MAKNRIKLAKYQRTLEEKQTEYVMQQTEMEVNLSFIKYKEAQNELMTLKKSVQLANDNYRIVEKKYLNQLALLTDMLDASTAKLTSELKYSNATVNILYQWYRLQKVSGNISSEY